MYRKEEEINNYNYKNNDNFRHSYGRLRRKIKNTDLNNIQNDNYFSNNVLYQDYNKNNYSNINKRNSKYLLKDKFPTNSKCKDIYTSYNYKNKNDNKNISNDYNYNNYNENSEINDRSRNKTTKPIVRPSKSAISNQRKCSHCNSNNSDYNYNNNNNYCSQNKNDEYLLCQNCINERLIEDKRRQRELSRKSNAPQIFEDKFKNYSENRIREKVEQRERNIKEIANNLEKWNNLSDKDKLIKENENSINPLYQDNHNYLYEKFRTKYEKKQKLINDNYNKFQNLERPEITDYFRNYVNNPKYTGISYGEYKPKKYDIDNYRKDLDEQINYRNNKIKKEKEEDILRENEQYNSALKNLENENKEKEIKKNKMKEELIKGNLELINSKKLRNQKINEEDLKYRDYYDKENMIYKNELLKEKDKKRKINKEFVIENQKNLSRIRRKKVEEMIENEKYRYNDNSYEPPKEATAECSNCHKIYPRKLLTSNAYFYGNRK